MLELLAELVSIPSLSREESQAADAVAARAEADGFDVLRIGNNVLFEFGAGSPRLLLHSHIDTIPPSSGWETDPFVPLVTADRVVGLGANDAKGCVTAILGAAARLKKTRSLPGTVVVAITAEEEIGGPGGITMVLPELGEVDAAIFGEPTGMAPCLAQSGMLLLDCTTRGDAGHAAHAGSLGLRNAIHLAARDIVTLGELEFEPFVDPAGQRHASRLQCTIIHGGTAANQVPDRCDFRVDLRSTPNLDHARVLAEIQAAAACELTSVSSRYAPRATDPDCQIARAALRATGRAATYSNTVSDWSLVPGIPSVKLGPGDSYRSHRPNEYLLANELAEGVETYIRLAELFTREWHHG